MDCNYKEINQKVMIDTVALYQSHPVLQSAIQYTIAHQYMVTEEQRSSLRASETSTTESRYLFSGKRTLEAAKEYPGKKVAVLNFANSHCIGGSPFRAGTQEESLCRCSTLFPCLQAMKEAFYDRHIRLFREKKIDFMGNDDLIYSPGVKVFKSDERTDPVVPQLLKEEDWYEVDVITCAAPELCNINERPADYQERIASRIRAILDVAREEQVEVLILGAWGCGAFKNPLSVVASTFRNELQHYDFPLVEFALATLDEVSQNPFTKAFQGQSSYQRPFTPSMVRRLSEHQIFVFGSNIRGFHMGGAARMALQQFGAEWGVGEGLTGQCYALPTMEGGVDYIGEKVQRFLQCAREHPSLTFLVTPVACGIAGFRQEEIAPLFRDALPMENVWLPEGFVEILESSL